MLREECDSVAYLLQCTRVALLGVDGPGNG